MFLAGALVVGFAAALWGGVVLAALYSMFAGWGIPAQSTC